MYDSKTELRHTASVRFDIFQQFVITDCAVSNIIDSEDKN